MNIKQDLAKVKGQLVIAMSRPNLQVCDYEQLEYLIQYIDWLLLGDIELQSKTILTLMEEIVTTSVHLLDLDILDTLPILTKLEREIYAKI